MSMDRIIILDERKRFVAVPGTLFSVPVYIIYKKGERITDDDGAFTLCLNVGDDGNDGSDRRIESVYEPEDPPNIFYWVEDWEDATVCLTSYKDYKDRLHAFRHIDVPKKEVITGIWEHIPDWVGICKKHL